MRLLKSLGIHTELDYGFNDVYSIPTERQIPIRNNVTFYSHKLKNQSKQQHEFTVKGVKIMASSRKDAIKKYNHIKK